MRMQSFKVRGRGADAPEGLRAFLKVVAPAYRRQTVLVVITESMTVGPFGWDGGCRDHWWIIDGVGATVRPAGVAGVTPLEVGKSGMRTGIDRGKPGLLTLYLRPEMVAALCPSPRWRQAVAT